MAAPAVDESGQVAACAITYAEVRGVLARYFHDVRLTEQEYASAAEAFKADWKTTHVVNVTPALLRQAGELLKGQVELRARDALQLTGALQVRALKGLRFLTFAVDLRRIAQALMPDA